ncbi:MAG: hypothetical protein JW395_2132 [Nitrospira sp.]|nr:hypothetical protein [Nitrospira sp.]
MQDIVIVQLQNQRNPAGEFSGAGFEKSQRSRVGIAAGIDRQLKMIEGTVSSGIGGKTPGRTMLESLVHGKDDQLTSPCQLPMEQQTGDVRFCSRIVAAVPAENLLYPISHVSPPVDS